MSKYLSFDALGPLPLELGSFGVVSGVTVGSVWKVSRRGKPQVTTRIVSHVGLDADVSFSGSPFQVGLYVPLPEFIFGL